MRLFILGALLVAAASALAAPMTSNPGPAVVYNSPGSPPMTGGTSGPGTASGAPTVTSVFPNNGPTVGGTSVVISGTNFQGVTAVKFGTNNAASFSYVGSMTINAVSPAGSAGTIHVTVVTPMGTSLTSSADQFTYSSCSQSMDFTQACNSMYIGAL